MADITIRQLAALAGVSRTTVSLALRNHPRLPEATRKRVQKIAAKHGYRQDPVVASLMTQLRTARAHRPSERIAYLTCWRPVEGWENLHTNDGYYLAGMRQRAHQLGYEVEHIWNGEPGMTPKRMSRILHTRAIKGVVFAPVFDSPGSVELTWEYFAAATTGFSVVKPNLHRTAHAHYNGMLLAIRELVRLGYRRFGYATRSDQDDRVNHTWLGALLAHQNAQPAEERVRPLIAPELDPVVLKEWIHDERPDVVISNWPSIPDMLADAGFDVPGDIGFASLDLFPRLHAFAGVDQLPIAVGSAAADLVVKQIQNNEFGLPEHPVTMLLNGVWRDGPTVRRIAPRKRAAKAGVT